MARLLLIASLLALMTSTRSLAQIAPPPLRNGVDISMLLEIERAGGTFNASGQPADALKILRDTGSDVFRIRLFLDPDRNFNATAGATLNLDDVIAIAKRVRTLGGRFMLCPHFSDTWADPKHQIIPKAWAGQSAEALETTLHDYMASVLKRLDDEGVPPDFVQIGNEVTAGICWPVGKLDGRDADEKKKQWSDFAGLLNAGARAVREYATERKCSPQIIIHVHGGGERGLPVWFFKTLDSHKVDYDIMAVSFYPAWGDSIEALKFNLTEMIKLSGRRVMVAETSYPWRTLSDINEPKAMPWPQTPDGQAAFLRDLSAMLRALPDGRAIGYVWWYPDAIPVKGLKIWRGGGEALFDDHGAVLPAAVEFGK